MQFPAKCGFRFLGVSILGLASVARVGAQTSEPATRVQSPLVQEQQRPLSLTASRTAESKDAAEKTTGKPGKAAPQGIKVHGHWIIDVRNPDGTVAEHRDFQNSLEDNGLSLANILAGRWTAGEWALLTIHYADNDPSPCGQATCVLSQFADGMFVNAVHDSCANGGGFQCFSGLNVAVGTFAKGNGVGYSLIVSGQFTASSTGTIGRVSATLANCAPSSGTGLSATPPSNCASRTNLDASVVPGKAPGAYNVSGFSGTALASPVQVTAGQTVALSVTYTFN